MPRITRYSPEVRVRAVRIVFDHREDYSSQSASAVTLKLGMTPETLRRWVRRAEIDGGIRAGLSTDQRTRLRELEREVRELRRAHEILQDASIFFATALDGRTKR